MSEQRYPYSNDPNFPPGQVPGNFPPQGQQYPQQQHIPQFPQQAQPGWHQSQQQYPQRPPQAMAPPQHGAPYQDPSYTQHSSPGMVPPQFGLMPQNPMQSPGGGYGAPPSGQRRSKKKLILSMVTAVAVMVASVGAFAFWYSGHDGTGQGQDVAGQDSNLPVIFQEPMRDIDPSHTFEFEVGYDPLTLDSYKNEGKLTDAFQVFSDPSLTNRVEAHARITRKGIQVVPPLGGQVAAARSNLGTDEEVVLKKDETWGLFDEYFLVERLDRDSGEPLKKPLVTPFSVANKLESPVVTTSVNEQGAAVFSWTEVPGADRYAIVKLEFSEIVDGLSYELIGTTENTTWNSVEQDPWVQDTEDGSHIISQNHAFRVVRFTEDELRSGLTGQLDEDTEPGDIRFGVFAMSGSKVSAHKSIDGVELAGQLPLQMAFHAQDEVATRSNWLDTVEEIPTQYAVTMADGRTVLQSVLVYPEGIKDVTLRSGMQDSVTGEVSGMHDVPGIKVPYSVTGTVLASEYTISGTDVATSRAAVEAVAERNRDLVPKTGLGAPFQPIESRANLDDIKPSSATPKVAYPVNGTTPQVKFLAANLIAGVEFIDMSAYSDDPIGPDVAIKEAIAQNPFMLSIESSFYYESHKILEVKYRFTDEERVQHQEAVQAKIDEVVAATITPKMTDLEKAAALNKYIIDNAEYHHKAADYDLIGPGTFPDAWTPYGVLIDGLGVCLSYAYAFKALGDQAGLENVVVYGNVGTVGHAWNRAKIDGNWRVFDVTWNDHPGNEQKYFNLTEAQLQELSSRTKRSDWISPLYIDNYEAK